MYTIVISLSLGGCSSINNMLYVRGDRAEYDNWAKNGCTGWGYDVSIFYSISTNFKDILPYFKKSEDYYGESNEYRSKGGPLTVQLVRDPREITHSWIEACVQSGIEKNPDYNGEKSTGVALAQTNIKDGVRWDAYTAWVKPVISRKNLNVVTETLVHKLLINDNK